MTYVALITGASSGIGEATARRLAQQPDTQLVLVARRGDRLRALARELGGDPTIIAADLTRAAAPARIAQTIEREHGALHLLVNNAGARWSGDFADGGWENVERNLRVNFKAPVRLVEALLPLLRATAVAAGGGGPLATPAAVPVRPPPTLGAGAAELGAGAVELGAGAAELGAGAVELGAGAVELGAGAVELGAGAVELGAGAVELGAGAVELGAGAVELGAGAVELGAGAVELGAGAVELGAGAVELGAGAVELGAGAVELGAGAVELGAGAAAVGAGGQRATGPAVPLQYGGKPLRAPVAIVNVSSTSGRVARRGTGGYAAAKFALAGWSDALALEEARHGVHVGLVLPGFVSTEGFPQAELRARRHTRWLVADASVVVDAILEAGPGGRAERYAPRYYGLFAALRTLTPALMRRALGRGTFTTATRGTEP